MYYGRDLFGTCDRVKGEFYVATSFTHLNFFPLIPGPTLLVVDGSESIVDESVEEYAGDFLSLRIARSWKSIALAWIRAVLLIAIAISGCILLFVLFVWLVSAPSWAAIRTSALTFGAAMVLYWLTIIAARPSAQRATMLRELLDSELPNWRDAIQKGRHPSDM